MASVKSSGQTSKLKESYSNLKQEITDASDSASLKTALLSLARRVHELESKLLQVNHPVD